MAREVTDPHDVAAVLAAARTVAVLGAHPATERPAWYVPAYLWRQGYRIYPVNPALVGTRLFGEPVRATLAELADAPGLARVDIVDVFRRAELLPGHLDDILAMVPRPGLVWLQAGIRNTRFAEALLAAGIDVVQDRCTLADHRAFRLSAVGPPPRDAEGGLGG